MIRNVLPPFSMVHSVVHIHTVQLYMTKSQKFSNIRLVSAWPVTANVLADSDACTFGLLK